MRTPKIKAYLKQIETGQIKTDAVKILDFIINNPDKNTEHLKSLLGMRWQTITARLSDLQDMGAIYVSNGEGRFSKWRFQPNKELQKAYARSRKHIKYLAWKKRGEKFKEFMN